MKKEAFIRFLQSNRIIAAVKDTEGVKNVLSSKCQVVFVLFGDLVNIPGIVKKIKETGKIVFVHVDLIEGLSSKNIAIDYIAKNTMSDGIISTRPNIIKYAKSIDLLTIQRFFILDSMALDNVSKHLQKESADAIEILPGLMPKIIKKLSMNTGNPIIAGGLISDEEDIKHAIDAGASAISSSNEKIWLLR